MCDTGRATHIPSFPHPLRTLPLPMPMYMLCMN